MKGRTATNPLAYRFYNPDEIVLGKRLEDHLRFAVAYWHSFVWPGGDPFGGQTFERPWFGDTMDGAKLKADVAFEMFSMLGAPYFCFHDADVRPEGDDLRRERRAPRRDRRLFRRQDGEDRRQAAVGHGQPLLQPPLHVGRGDQSRSRMSLPMPPRR